MQATLTRRRFSANCQCRSVLFKLRIHAEVSPSFRTHFWCELPTKALESGHLPPSTDRPLRLFRAMTSRACRGWDSSLSDSSWLDISWVIKIIQSRYISLGWLSPSLGSDKASWAIPNATECPLVDVHTTGRWRHNTRTDRNSPKSWRSQNCPHISFFIRRLHSILLLPYPLSSTKLLFVIILER